MKFLNPLVITLALVLSLGILPSASAAGKIENATASDVKEAVEGAISHSEQALSGLQSGANKDMVLQNITTARQESKRIEIGRLDLKRNQASGKLKAARAAIEINEKEKAEELLKEAIKTYQDIKGSL